MTSRVRDGLVLVPLVAVILFLALYPQFALHRSEGSVKSAVFERTGASQHNSQSLAVPLLRRHGEHGRDASIGHHRMRTNDLSIPSPPPP